MSALWAPEGEWPSRLRALVPERVIVSNALLLLRILAAGVLAEIIKTHWVAARRVSGTVGRALPYAQLGTTLVVGGVIAGASLGGLEGLAVGRLIGEVVQGAAMTPLVVRTARLSPGARTLAASTR